MTKYQLDQYGMLQNIENLFNKNTAIGTGNSVLTDAKMQLSDDILKIHPY